MGKNRNGCSTLTPPTRFPTRHYTTPNPLHTHVKWEILIFEKGVSRNIVNGITFDNMTRGDVFVLGPNHPHIIEFVEEPHGHWDIYCTQEEMKTICCSFDGNFYENIAKSNTPPHLKLQPNIFDAIISELKGLEKLSLMAEADTPKAIATQQSVANGLIHYILSLYVKQEWKKNDPIPDWFYEVAHKLRQPENFAKRINDIVGISNYSHAQFSKKFKEYTGMSLIEYIVNLRLDYATALLTQTNKSILDIALETGYSSVSFFIKIFRKKYGVTPMRYKKLIEGGMKPLDSTS